MALLKVIIILLVFPKEGATGHQVVACSTNISEMESIGSTLILQVLAWEISALRQLFNFTKRKMKIQQRRH